MPPPLGSINNPSGKGGFQKGQSGNPGGRKKGSTTFTNALMERLEALVDDCGTTELDEIIASLVVHAKQHTRAAVEAAKLIAAYADGLPARNDGMPGFGDSGGGVVLILPSNGREMPIVDENQVLMANVSDGRASITFPEFESLDDE